MTNTVTKEALQQMNLNGIAKVIDSNWSNVYFGAVPYLNALYSLNGIKDNYGFDSADSIVRYFLANARTWKGDVAKLVKSELLARLKG